MLFFSPIKNFGYRDFGSRLYKRIFEEDIFNSAAQVAFFFAFALFPLLLFLISLFGLVLNTADELRGELFYYLRQIMPYTAYELVLKTIKEVTENSSGGKLTIGLAIALWSASAGIDNIRIALNSVYNLDEQRAWWKTKLLSLVLTFALTIFIMIALGIVLYGSQFVAIILSALDLPIPSPFILVVLQYSTILIVLILSFGLIYNFCPSFEKTRWVWISPGAIAGIVLWLLVSAAFRLYLNYFDTYAKTYGSLGAVIVLMLWLYLTAVVILFGGLINSIFKNMSAAGETLENESTPDNSAASDEKQPAQISESNSEIYAKTKQIRSNSPAVEKIQVDDIKPENHLIQKERDVNKPILNLIIGTIFGVFAGLIYSKRKRD